VFGVIGALIGPFLCGLSFSLVTRICSSFAVFVSTPQTTWTISGSCKTGYED